VKEHNPQYVAEPITEDHPRKKKFPGECPEKQANHIDNRDIDKSVIPINLSLIILITTDEFPAACHVCSHSGGRRNPETGLDAGSSPAGRPKPRCLRQGSLLLGEF